MAGHLGALALGALAVGTPCDPAPNLPKLAGRHFEDHQLARIARNGGDCGGDGDGAFTAPVGIQGLVGSVDIGIGKQHFRGWATEVVTLFVI